MDTSSRRSHAAREPGRKDREDGNVATPPPPHHHQATSTKPRWCRNVARSGRPGKPRLAWAYPVTGDGRFSGGLGWHPGVAGEGVADRDQWGDTVVAGGGQVGTGPAVALQAGQSAPTAADLESHPHAAQRLLRSVVRPRHGEVGGEGPDLGRLPLQAFGQDESGAPAAPTCLQLRTRVLNDSLADDFRRWHPGFTHVPDRQVLAA